MAHKKNNYALILAGFLLVLTGCKKQKLLIEAEPTHYVITVNNSETGEGYSGVYYEVIETHIEDPGLGATVSNTVIANGETDTLGRAKETFYKKYVTNSDYLVYTYKVDVIVSDQDVEFENYQVLIDKWRVPIDTIKNGYGFFYKIVPE